MTLPEFEEWRPVPGASDYYEVSSFGRVRSWTRRGGKGRHFPTPRLMQTPVNHNGYRTVNLDQRNLLLHRVVCEAFHGPALSGQSDCRHLDGDRLNNRADNLAWGTRADNEGDKVRHGRGNAGSRCGTSKLTEPDVVEIRLRYASGEMLKIIQQDYPVTQPTLSAIVNRKTWRHV